MESNVLKPLTGDTMTYFIFRAKGSPPDQITGAGLTMAIQDGSLVIFTNGVVNFVYGPNQWVTVNQNPI